VPLEDVSRQLDGAIEALQALHATLRELRAEIGGAQQRVEAPVVPERLRQVVEQVGQDRPARPVLCPDEFVRQWNLFVAGRGQAPEARGIRFLCWEPDVANSAGFRRHLVASGFDLRVRSIQGLVRSCHLRWSRELLGTNGAVEFVRHCLRGYRGPNRVLKRWRDREDLLFDHAPFARDLLAAGRTPHEQAAQWHVDAQSVFFLSALEVAAEAIRAPRSRATADDVRNVLFWDGWELGRFKKEIGRTLVLPDVEQRPALRELVPLVLSDARLRDPRLPANAKNWVGVPTDARDTFIRWLAAADIEFFFEHVLPRGSDPHGRKPFWLQYLNSVKRSRTLLSSFHLGKLKHSRETLIEAGSFGRTYSDNISAFLLDFGNLLVVEFSEPGNAGYCYGPALAKQIVPDFWIPRAFPIWNANRDTGELPPSLKQADLVPSVTRETVGHRKFAMGFRFSHMSRWQETVRQQLAIMGIRPS
jgi:hypothetical protein